MISPITNALAPLSGDQSLSRRDFLIELSTWFRRAIWFLVYTAAYTLSAPLALVAVSQIDKSTKCVIIGTKLPAKSQILQFPLLSNAISAIFGLNL